MKNIKKACVYFHQGWTDIIMCSPLINFYKSKYDVIYVLIRSEAKELIDFYIREIDDIHIIYLDTDNGRFYGGFNTMSDDDKVVYSNNIVTIPKDFDLLFHAEHDKYRKDHFRNYWYMPDTYKKQTNHFSEMFYVFYDIDYINRIDYFSVKRDFLLEETLYQNFIEEYGKDYVLYHDDENNHESGHLHISTKIDFNSILENHTYVNLNKKTNIFFDYIKIIENAKEIHLVDSIWACLIYQLDAKYGLFKNKEINVYCKRGHQNLFLYPVNLKNWKII
jgi:hypothetical protein